MLFNNLKAREYVAMDVSRILLHLYLKLIVFL